MPLMSALSPRIPVSWFSLCLILPVVLEFSWTGKLALSHFMMFLTQELSSIGSITLPSLVKSIHILILWNVWSQWQYVDHPLKLSPTFTQCPHVWCIPCTRASLHHFNFFCLGFFILMTFTYNYKPAWINSLDPAASLLTRWLLPFVISHIPKENDCFLTKWNRASTKTISVASQSKEWLIANNVLENLREAPGKKKTRTFYLKYILFPGLAWMWFCTSCNKHLHSTYSMCFSLVGCQNIATESILVKGYAKCWPQCTLILDMGCALLPWFPRYNL